VGRAGSTVLVDLTATTFIDSALVNWLLRAEARLEAAGRSLVIIAGPSGSFAATVLRRTGTREAFRRSTRSWRPVGAG
jgi:anti-anti-sigma regulatory factor